jgi:hypothetical protein
MGLYAVLMVGVLHVVFCLAHLLDHAARGMLQTLQITQTTCNDVDASVLQYETTLGHIHTLFLLKLKANNCTLQEH